MPPAHRYTHLCESGLESLSALNPCQHHYSTFAADIPPGFAHLASHPSTGSTHVLTCAVPNATPFPPRAFHKLGIPKGVQRQPGTGTEAQVGRCGMRCQRRFHRCDPLSSFPFCKPTYPHLLRHQNPQFTQIIVSSFANTCLSQAPPGFLQARPQKRF